MNFVKTRAVCNPIGLRKAPSPNGHAGFVRIDTVHKGDLDGVKGVHHITCVDEVSQWQMQVCVQGISEAFPAADAGLDPAAVPVRVRLQLHLTRVFASSAGAALH